MSINTIIGIIVAIVVIGAGGYYLSTMPAPEAPAPEGAAQTEGSTGTFADILALGGSSTCTVSVEVTESPAEGTAYISGDEVRVDFTARPANMGSVEITAHMIQTGGYVYSWTDLLPQGVKVKAESAAGAAESQGISANASVRYSCAPWIADASKFVPPSNVTFMEFSAENMPAIPQPR